MPTTMHARKSSPFFLGWTGKAPEHCAGFDERGVLRSLPQVSVHASRKEVRDYFDNGWTLTELLFSALASEDAFLRRPYHQLRHPMIFYYGHPVALYVNKLLQAGLIAEPVNPALEKLFAQGVDEMSWDDLYDGRQDVWPSLAEVHEYRRQVYSIVANLIDTHAGLPMRITDESPLNNPLWALFMGFEHERIHLETSSVLIRELPLEYVRVPAAWPSCAPSPRAEQTRMVPLPACQVVVGKPKSEGSFGWDNEYGLEARSVKAFEAGDTLVTNAEFAEFVAAGGYQNPSYWSRDGWGWKEFRQAMRPTFWRGDTAKPRLRTVFEEIDMPWGWPVCVNFHEAKAYCAWRSQHERSPMPYRLLTEAEHMALRDTHRADANLDLRFGSECGVRALTASTKGFHDVFGNVWQWGEDHFHPLSGSEPHPFYDDFSTPCYDGEHQMIFGGSFISTGDMAGAFARFHFRPHFFQHAGFRLARSVEGTPDGGARKLPRKTSTYETQEMLGKYLMMHYGNDNDISASRPLASLPFPQVVHLPLRCAELVQQFASGTRRAMDLGCAVGRSSFELARQFDEVVGIDYSREFVAAATVLRKKGEMIYWRKDSGAEGAQAVARVDLSIDRNRVCFEQGDACDIAPYYQGFDAVLLANVLCRLPEPMRCLERMQGQGALVAQGGVLVMTTPFSWLEEFTPRENWLEGVSAVKKALHEFELIHQEEIPFVIREHARKYEYIITLASVWRRR